jgi:hypothetical protein
MAKEFERSVVSGRGRRLTCMLVACLCAFGGIALRPASQARAMTLLQVTFTTAWVGDPGACGTNCDILNVQTVRCEDQALNLACNLGGTLNLTHDPVAPLCSVYALGGRLNYAGGGVPQAFDVAAGEIVGNQFDLRGRGGQFLVGELIAHPDWCGVSVNFPPPLQLLNMVNTPTFEAKGWVA